MYDQIEATNIVTLLYQSVLGRDPDAAGLEQYVEALVSSRQTITQIIREFAASPEYAKKNRLLNPKLTQFRSFPDAEVFVPPEVVDQLFDKTSFYWRHAASEPNEMYWSVLTQQEWNRELTGDDRVKFVGTGRRYTNRVLELYEKCSGRSVANLTCIDFGSGVGRLAINFASRVAQVHAVDFSESHLQELQRNAVLFDCASKNHGLADPASCRPRQAAASRSCVLVHRVAAQHAAGDRRYDAYSARPPAARWLRVPARDAGGGRV